MSSSGEFYKFCLTHLPGDTDAITPVQLIFDGTNIVSLPCIAEKFSIPVKVNFRKTEVLFLSLFVTNTSGKARQLETSTSMVNLVLGCLELMYFL